MTKKEIAQQAFMELFIEEYGPADAYCRELISDISKYLLINKVAELRGVVSLWKIRKSRIHGDAKLKLIETELFKWVYLVDTGKIDAVRTEWLNEALSNGMTKKQLTEKVLDECLLFIEKN